MRHKKLQSTLKDALESKIPSSEIDLWPAINADLEARKRLQTQKRSNMKSFESQRRPQLILAISVTFILLVVLAATPQGRSFAQSIIEFFTPTESTTFQLENSQIVLDQSDLNATPALPPAPLISVSEAEAQVGFDVAELTHEPEGLDFLGVRLYGNYVSLEYQTEDLGGHLNIKQSQEGYYQSNWDSVPAEAVIPVQIGSLSGEFVKGTFVVYPGDSVATWNPDAAIIRLRWKTNGIWYEITKFGDVTAIEYLDMAEMVKIAEDLNK